MVLVKYLWLILSQICTLHSPLHGFGFLGLFFSIWFKRKKGSASQQAQKEGLSTWILSGAPKRGCSSKTRVWALGRSHGWPGANLFCEETDDFYLWDRCFCNFLATVKSIPKWQAKGKNILNKLQMNGVFSCLLGNIMSILPRGPYPVSFSGCYNCGLYIGCITNVNL